MKHEEFTAAEEIMALDQALLCAVVEAAGAVTVRREDISRCLREKRQLRAEYDAAEGVWRLTVGEAEA